MKWLRKSCPCRENVSLLAAGALSASEKAELESHLAKCEECRAYCDEIKAVTRALAEWEKSFAAIEATPAAQRRWATVVRESGAPADIRLNAAQKVWRIVWDELIWPSRYAWSALAALWVAMLLINRELSVHRPSGAAGGATASSQDLIQAWEEQTRVLAGLVQPDQSAFTVFTPAPYVPRPRSQKDDDTVVI